MLKVEPGSTDSPSSVAGLGGPKTQPLKVKQAAAQSACCRVLVTKSREHGRPSFAFVDGAGNCRACGCHGCKDHMICSSCSETVVCCSCDCYSDEHGHTVSDDCSRHRDAKVTSSPEGGRRPPGSQRLSSVRIQLLSLPIRTLPVVLARDNYIAFRVYLTRHWTDETLLHFR